MARRLDIFIVDACVLIDFCEADRTILRAIVEHVGPVRVLASILAEVDILDANEAMDLGLDIITPDLDQAAAAANSVGPLSFNDRLCLVTAEAAGWTCVTNDGRLRRACQERKVPVAWGLELVGHAVKAAAITPDDAVDLAEAIHEASPRYITEEILDRFKREVRRVR